MHAKIRAIPIESCDDPAEATAQRELAVKAFNSLDEDDRELLLLIAWEGLSIAEVADVMDISPGTAGVRIHRARRRLALCLDPTTAVDEEKSQ